MSKVLPAFSTTCELGLPCINLDPATSQYSATNVTFEGALCFSLMNVSNPCIWLANGSIGNWQNPLQHNQIPVPMLSEALAQITASIMAGSGDGSSIKSTAINVTTLLMLMESVRPSTARSQQSNSSFRQILPYCAPNLGYPPHWTPCQSPIHKLKQVSPGFEFSPPLGKHAYDFANSSAQKTGGQNVWPWFQ